MLFAAIQNFLAARIAEHPHLEPWLATWNPACETQINIDPTALEPVQPGLWLTQEGYEVRPIRIPHGSNTENPTFRDRPLRGPVHHHWHSFGTTGWNWEQRRSEWVGFDFDSIEGHLKGLEPDQLTEIRNRALALPYVVARTSTGGRGLHLLVNVNRPTTRTHGEHALLAKDVLRRMSQDCGYPIHNGVDCQGLVLWHWRKGIDDACLRRIPRYEGMATS